MGIASTRSRSLSRRRCGPPWALWMPQTSTPSRTETVAWLRSCSTVQICGCLSRPRPATRMLWRGSTWRKPRAADCASPSCSTASPPVRRRRFVRIWPRWLAGVAWVRSRFIRSRNSRSARDACPRKRSRRSGPTWRELDAIPRNAPLSYVDRCPVPSPRRWRRRRAHSRLRGNAIASSRRPPTILSSSLLPMPGKCPPRRVMMYCAAK